MTDLKDKKAQKGGKTFFTMKIRGEPIPEVTWYGLARCFEICENKNEIYLVK